MPIAMKETRCVHSVLSLRVFDSQTARTLFEANVKWGRGQNREGRWTVRPQASLLSLTGISSDEHFVPEIVFLITGNLKSFSQL